MWSKLNWSISASQFYFRGSSRRVESPTNCNGVFSIFIIIIFLKNDWWITFFKHVIKNILMSRDKTWKLERTAAMWMGLQCVIFTCPHRHFVTYSNIRLDMYLSGYIYIFLFLFLSLSLKIIIIINHNFMDFNILSCKPMESKIMKRIETSWILYYFIKFQLFEQFKGKKWVN